MADQPRIIRVVHDKDNPYVSIHRDTLQDERLSWEARGVLAYLLSKPNDWRVDPRDLQQKCGKNKVYAILKELEALGYVTVETPRDKKGRIVAWHYTIYERPFVAAAEHNPVDPLPENQEVDKQEVEEPDLAKRQHTNNRNIQRRESTKQVVTPAAPPLDPEFQLMLYAILDTTGRDYHLVPDVMGYVRKWRADGYRAEDVALAYQELRQNDWRWTDPKRGNPGRKASLEDLNEALGQVRTVGRRWLPEANLEATLRRVRATGDFGVIDPDYVPALGEAEHLALSA